MSASVGRARRRDSTVAFVLLGKLPRPILVYPWCGGRTAMFEGLFQPMHLVVILAIALLVFGPKKLPELGKGLGESIRGFKDALNGSSASEAAKGEASASRPEPPKSPEPPKGV